MSAREDYDLRDGRLRVLFVHNRYRQPGGEDVAFAAEAQLLRERGHVVVEYIDDNERIETSSVRAAISATWSLSSARKIAAIIRSNQIAVMHCHNTFPLVSPSAYYAASRYSIPVVQTLHNYRLLCPAATCFRGGVPCIDCIGRRFPVDAVKHACYRGSRAGSAAVGAMLATHRALGTYQRKVNAYIALTSFGRDIFSRSGLPAERIWIKPNFLVSDPGVGRGDGRYALFVGRLVPEKGIEVALRAWAVASPPIPLRIVGDGPLRPLVEGIAAENANVTYLGQKPRDEVFRLIKSSACLVFPSIWYEGLPMTIVEAFACGTPVIASRLGAMAELVQDARNGLLFTAGDDADLRLAVSRLVEEKDRLPLLRQNARDRYLNDFTAQKNYEILKRIYSSIRPTAHAD